MRVANSAVSNFSFLLAMVWCAPTFAQYAPPLVIGVDHIRESNSGIEHVYLPVVSLRSDFEPVQRWEDDSWTMWSARTHLLSEWPEFLLVQNGEPTVEVPLSVIEGRPFQCNTLTAGIANASTSKPSEGSPVSGSTFGFDPLHGKQEFRSSHFLAFSGDLRQLAASGSARVSREASFLSADEIGAQFASSAAETIGSEAILAESMQSVVRFEETELQLLETHWESTKRNSWDDGPASTMVMIFWRNVTTDGEWTRLANSVDRPDGWGVGLAFLDGFALSDGRKFLVFETRGYESVGYRIYEVADSRVKPEPVFDQTLYGC